MSALSAAFAALCAAPAFAGTELVAVTRVESSGPRLPALGETRVRLRVDGERARAEYLASALRSIPRGSVLVSDDGGRSARLYDPENRTCAEARATGGVAADGMPGAPAQYEDIRVEQTLDEAGARIAGAKTRHRRYAIGYTTRPGGGAAAVRTTTTLDVWTAPALADAGFALWLQPFTRSGNATLDESIAAAIGSAPGAVLQRIEQTVLAFKGTERRSTTTLRVTSLQRRTWSPHALDPPFVCRIGPTHE